MTAGTYDDQFGAVKAQLKNLRDSLPEVGSYEKYVRLIDEFMRQHEFGLVLESICDFLLEPVVPTPGSATITQVETLHRLMAVEDVCLDKLRRKVGQS